MVLVGRSAQVYFRYNKKGAGCTRPLRERRAGAPQEVTSWPGKYPTGA